MRYTIFLLTSMLLTLNAGECVRIEALYAPSLQTCIQEAGPAPIDVASCYDRELRRWDKKLNDAYRKFKRTIPPERIRNLVKVQRAWIAYRDAKCGFFYDKYSGSGGLADAAKCRLDMTIQRTQELLFGTP